MKLKLKVLPVGKALVPDYEAFADGVLRFIGRKHDASIGLEVEFLEGKNKVKKKSGGWVPCEEPVVVPFRKEYLDELKAGTLLPADKETADLAGISFTKGNK